MKDQQEGLPWAICCNPLWKLPEIKEHIAAPGWEPWGTGEHNQRIIDHKHELCAEMRLLSALLARGEEVLKAEILLRLLSAPPGDLRDFMIISCSKHKTQGCFMEKITWWLGLKEVLPAAPSFQRINLDHSEMKKKLMH